MKKIIFMVAALATFTMALAQDEAEQPKYWKYSGVIGLNANGTGMINWAAGGNNNIAGDVFGKFNVGYEKNNLSWDALLDIDYGLTFVDQKYDKLQKTSDHLNFDTKFGWAFQPKWYLTVNAGFHTQFDLGRNYSGDDNFDPIISNILAPSYTDISVGFDYKPVDFFSLYMSPVSGRISTAYVSDKMNQKYAEYYPVTPLSDGLRQSLQEAYGTWYFDDLNNKVFRNYRAELGLNIKAALNYKYKDLTLMSNLSLFTPYQWDKVQMYELTGVNDGLKGFITETEYQALAQDDKSLYSQAGYRDNGRRFGNFDVDWNVTLSYQFLKVLNVTLYTDLKYVNGQMIDKVYDKGLATERVESAERIQFLGNLGIGVGYSF